MFDGFGGDDISNFCSENATEALEKTTPTLSIRQRIQQTLNSLIEQLQVKKGAMEKIGTTACLCLKNKEEICIANIGDSGAMILKKNGNLRRITTEHSVENKNELARIEKLGGVLLNGGGKIRLQGELSITRAIGSTSLHPYLSEEAEYIEPTLEEEDAYIILGSDGILKHLGDKIDSPIRKSPLEIANKIQEIAVLNGSKDNTTVVAIELIV